MTRTWLHRRLDCEGYDGEALAPYLLTLLDDSATQQATIEEMLDDNPALALEVLNKWRNDRAGFLAEEPASKLPEQDEVAPDVEPDVEPAYEPAPELEPELVYDYEEEDADTAAAKDAENQLYVLTSLCETEKWSIDAVHSAITAACSQEDTMVDAALLEENTRVLLEFAEQACISCKPCRHLLQDSGCFTLVLAC